jgi:hypothetical protein
MRDYGVVRADTALAGSRPVRSIVAITLGGLIVIPELVSLIGTVRRLQRTERVATGHARSGSLPIALFTAQVILPIASQVHGLALLRLPALGAFFAAAGLVQARLNRAWSAPGAALNGSAPSAEGAPGTSIADPEHERAAIAPIAPASS